MSVHGEAYFLDTAKQPLARREIVLSDPKAGEALLEVEACGLCHTDLGFADGSVAPKHALPLVLGHEVVGRVLSVGGDAFAGLVGKRVIVPAVMPCGDCAFCRAGRGNACPGQKMPGNDIDGGFATHMLSPAAPLVLADGAPASMDTAELSVVADAVSTAYQAIKRSGLGKGDAAFVVGSGGVGGFVIQIAHALGAHVAACDVDEARLAGVLQFGADLTVDVKGKDPREVKKQVHAFAKGKGVASLGYRIFECSGTTDGQTLAYSLLGQAATYVQVGFTRKPVEVRLSNLMAFDATVHGSWGAPPDAYPDVLRLIYEGKVALSPFVARAPMSRVNDLLADMAGHKLSRRMILDPRA